MCDKYGLIIYGFCFECFIFVYNFLEIKWKIKSLLKMFLFFGFCFRFKSKYEFYIYFIIFWFLYNKCS